jgi:hypothetical protein
MTYSYQRRENRVVLGITAAFAAIGPLLMLIPGDPDLRKTGAIILPLFLTVAVCMFFGIKNKSITLTGDRIQIVLATGRTLDYGANQISIFRYHERLPTTSVNQRLFSVICFNDGLRFQFSSSISDYDRLIEELKAIAPPTARQPSRP